MECLCSVGENEDVKAAHLFLQRILYRINRMVLFWCALTGLPKGFCLLYRKSTGAVVDSR